MKFKKVVTTALLLMVPFMLPAVLALEETPKPQLTAEAVQVNVENIQTCMNILWTCLAAFLVFFMQAGFAMVESGFTRAKNSCNIMMKNLLDFSVGTIAWYVCGFAFMFAAGGAFIGTQTGFFGLGIDKINPELTWSFWIFQCVFAGTAATIVSGAMAGRTKFTGYLAYSAVICAIIYPVSGHWIWGGGWLSELGFMDFAGSTVVHSCGGWLALAGATVLGPRIGKYSPEGKSKPILGHNIPIAALGVFILWFGWFGFNPGSTTAVVPEIGYIAVTTNLAAAAGAITAMLTAWIRFKKPDVSMSLNGVLAGLVGITAGCNAVTLPGAIIIGAAAGVICVLSVEFVDKVLKIDDPVGAVSVHGVCGTWGTLALSFFLVDKPESISKVFFTQLAGVASVFAWAFICGLVIFSLIKFTIGLRATEEEELRGLDITEHGNEAYSGFQIFISH